MQNESVVEPRSRMSFEELLTFLALGSRSLASLETFNTTRCIEGFFIARVEGVASTANFHLNFLLGGTYFK